DLGALASDLETPATGLAYEIVSQPTKGTLTVAGSIVRYAPAADANGADSFTFRVSDRGDPDGCSILEVGCDGPTSSETGTVRIAIAPVNDRPIAHDDAARVAENATLTLTGADLTGNDVDVDGDALSVTAVGASVHG